MSEEEAIHILKKERYDIEPICSEGKIFIKALDMAIKALECQKSSKEQANTKKIKGD